MDNKQRAIGIKKNDKCNIEMSNGYVFQVGDKPILNEGAKVTLKGYSRGFKPIGARAQEIVYVSSDDPSITEVIVHMEGVLKKKRMLHGNVEAQVNSVAKKLGVRID